MVEARIQCLPDYIEAQQAFPDRQDSLDFLTHNLFDGADWFDDDDIGALICRWMKLPQKLRLTVGLKMVQPSRRSGSQTEGGQACMYTEVQQHDRH